MGAPALSPFSDTDLETITSAWPSLPDHIRQAILTLVQAGGAAWA